MLWVGGSIIIHGLAELGVHGPELFVEHAAEHVRDALVILPAIVAWLTTSVLQGLLGIAVGAVVVGALRLLQTFRSDQNEHKT